MRHLTIPAILLLSLAPALAQADASTPPTVAHLRDASRGIHVQAQPTPSGTHPSYTPVTSGGRPGVDLTVEFRSGSAELTPSAPQTLDALGTAMTSADLAKFRFRIEGHADDTGSLEVNLTLSGQRDDAAATYLESKFAIDAARLEAVGTGEADPVVKTPPQTAEPRNRRVEVIALGA